MDGHRTRAGISANLIVGVLSTAWTAIIALVSIGWFVKLVGVESYGLIGFFATMQTALSVLDLGLGSTVNREVARGTALNDLARISQVIRSLQMLYLVMALVIGAVIFVGAPFIAKYWLGSSSLNDPTVEWSIRLMGVVIALRWPIGLYQGTLVGLQRANISYGITATMATISNVGAIVLLYAFDRTLLTYFAWQVFSAFMFLVWIRSSALREIGPGVAGKWNRRVMRSLLCQSVTMGGVALAGVLWSQLDKLTVSGSVSLADFGRYSLSSLVASALVVILIPTFNVIYPRMSGLFASGKIAEVIEFYRAGSMILVAALIPISGSAFFYAEDLLYVWTGDQGLAETTAPIVRLLVIGAASNGLMNFPYAAQLASGHERLALCLNVALISTAPIMLLLAMQYGLWGAAVGWIMQTGLYFIGNVMLTHLFIFKGTAMRWLFSDLAPGIIVAMLLIGIGREISISLTDSSILRLGLATLISVTATLVVVFCRRRTRTSAVRWYRGWAVA